MSRNLTKKQRGFVNDLAEGKPGVVAALDNYDTEDYNTAAVISSENLIKPNIIQELQKLGFDSNNANRVVGEILNDESNEPRDRLKAAELVYKVKGDMAPEKHLIVTKKIISVDE